MISEIRTAHHGTEFVISLEYVVTAKFALRLHEKESQQPMRPMTAGYGVIVDEKR